MTPGELRAPRTDDLPSSSSPPRPSGRLASAGASGSRRLASPSESGRLPLPEELGVAPTSSGPAPLELTDAGFADDVLAAPVPVIVDFWAETCVPCRLQEPTIRRLARELEGRARVGRLNVYDNPETTDRYRIKGVPHMVVFCGGEVVLELVGDHSLEQLRYHLGRVGVA